MKKLLEYIIPFEGLKNGPHRFDFNITDTFFEDYGTTIDFHHTDLQVVVNLMKSETMLVFDFSIKGHVVFPCDRCLDEYVQPINTEQKLIVKFGEEDEGDKDTVITLSHAEHEIHLAYFLNDYILLALPMKRICANQIPAKACNEAMIQRIEAMQAVPKSDNEPDPRWEGLKKLKE